MGKFEVGELTSRYFQYIEATEPHWIFHRWCFFTVVGAYLGRSTWLQFGDNRIFPNQYTMLFGTPGSRKSTAVNHATKLIRLAGYSKFSSEKTSKEKFLEDLAEGFFVGKKSGDPDDVLADLVMSLNSEASGREVLVAADEFNNFVGSGNIEFLSLLGQLWDWDKPDVAFSSRIKHGKSVEIFQPFVSILAGNTPTNFAIAFPEQAIGQGFMSRLILIHAQGTRKKLHLPPALDSATQADLVDKLKLIKEAVSGPMRVDDGANACLKTLYDIWTPLEDSRFEHYSTRRYTHLMKLAVLSTALRADKVIGKQDVVFANTVLSHAERFMPQALGQYGKSKLSLVTSKVLSIISTSKMPLTGTDIYPRVSTDLDKPEELWNILQNLTMARKIQQVGKNHSYMACAPTTSGSFDMYNEPSRFLQTDEQLPKHR